MAALQSVFDLDVISNCHSECCKQRTGEYSPRLIDPFGYSSRGSGEAAKIDENSVKVFVLSN